MAGFRYSHYYYLFDLYYGVMIISLCGFTVMITSAISNIILDNNLYEPKVVKMQTGIIITYLIIALGVHVLLFAAVHEENQLLILIAMGCYAAIFVIWIIFTILSFFEPTYRYSCIYNRCPEFHWLFTTHWRNVQIGRCTFLAKMHSMEKPIKLSNSIDHIPQDTRKFQYSNNTILMAGVNNTDITRNVSNITTSLTASTSWGNEINQKVFYPMFESGCDNDCFYPDDQVADQFRFVQPEEFIEDKRYMGLSIAFACIWFIYSAYAFCTIVMYYLELRDGGDEDDEEEDDNEDD